MRKILALFISLVLIFCTIPVLQVSAEQLASGVDGDITWSIDDGVLTISGNGDIPNDEQGWDSYNSEILEVVIESGVKAIGRYAFDNCVNLTSVTIPFSVTRIGDWAFVNCASLTSLTIYNDVTDIGHMPFDGCDDLVISCAKNSSIHYYCEENNIPIFEIPPKGECGENLSWTFHKETGELTITGYGEMYDFSYEYVSPWARYGYYISTISLPDGLTSIGSQAFAWCEAVVSINIPTTVERIGKEAFLGCYCLETVNIPNGVTEIAQGTFENCQNLSKIIIPDSVTSIGTRAFGNCQSLTSITIPAWVNDIADDAFQLCNGLEIIIVEEGNSVYHSDSNCLIETNSKTLVAGCNNSVIPADDSVEIIGNYAFSGRTELSTIEIPYGVTHIGMGAFTNCCSLTEIIIPESVTYIGEVAFGYCSSLKTIEIPDSVKTIESGAFGACESLTSIELPNGITRISDYLFTSCSNLTSVNIPNSVTEIGYGAFSYCYMLPSITIPAGVTKIETGIFASCNSLKSIIVEDGNPVYHSDGNCIIETDSKTLVAGCNNSVIPSDGSVEIIGTAAFNDCVQMTDIVIPNTIKSIGESAFYGCSDLASIEIPNSVTHIGDWAFASCYNLSFITIPGSVTSFGEWIFSDINPALYVQTGSYAHAYAVENYFSYIASGSIVSMEITSLPEKLVYPIGGRIKTNGLVVIGTCDDGSSYDITPNCNIENFDTSSAGVKTVNVTYNDSVCDFEITVDPDLISYPESYHPYGNYTDESWEYKHPTPVKSLKITFSEDTETEEYNDYIYIYDLYGNEIGYYSGTELAGQTIEVPGKTFTIRLTSNHSRTKNGFSITNIEAVELCTHNFVDFSCTECGKNLPNGMCGENLIWTYDDDLETLTVTGSGEMYDFDYEPPWSAYSSYISTVVLPEELTSIGSYAFNWCDNLTTINIPSAVKEIGDGAFRYCTSLESFDIPVGVTEISRETFQYCTNLASVTIPEGVTFIDNYAFSECKSLTTINLPASVSIIYGNVFEFCNNLDNISVKEGNPVFHVNGNCLIETENKILVVGCNNSVIPTDGSVTTIGNNAFCGRERLETITIPTGVSFIESFAFAHCDNLACVEIPDGVTDIGHDAFIHCSSLAAINIPASVEYIGESAFGFCSSLESITVEDGNLFHHSYGNCLIATDSKTLIAGCKNSVIPTDGSVTVIGNWAFTGCSELTSIFIPDTITSIGNLAFNGCNTLSEINIPNSVTSIGDSAFSACYSLTALTIPASVINIGENVFGECENITLLVKTGSYAHNYAVEYNIPFEASGIITSIEVTNLPTKLTYPIGGKFTTNGLVITAIYDDGSTCNITASCDLSECDMSTEGVKTVTVSYGELSCSFEITVDPDLILFPESDHPYQDYTDETWYYTHPTDAYRLRITFSDDTETEDGCDRIYIYNSVGELVGEYSGYQLAGRTVEVPGNAFSIRLVTDGSVTYNGFTVTDVQAVEPCNHNFIDFRCTECDLYLSNGGCGENLSWIYDEENRELTISGSGDMYLYDSWSTPWSWCNDSIKNIFILNGVPNISSYAFYNCENLTSVIIPDSVKNIGEYAFPNSNNFTLKVWENSYAHTYAVNNDIAFELLDENCSHENTSCKNITNHHCQCHGYTGDTYCIDCGATITAGKITPPEHNYRFFVTIEPTCENTGYTIHKCMGCDMITFTSIEAIGHNTVFSHRIEATYTSPAMNVFVCEECGTEVYKEFGFALCDFNKDGMLNQNDYDAFGNSATDLTLFDFNNNGEADDFDLTVVKHLMNNVSLQEIGDVNRDGTTNLKDLVRAKKILAGYSAEGDIDRNFDGSADANDLIFLSDFVICFLFGNR